MVGDVNEAKMKSDLKTAKDGDKGDEMIDSLNQTFFSSESIRTKPNRDIS
jgi:hypothetical protein